MTTQHLHFYMVKEIHRHHDHSFLIIEMAPQKSQDAHMQQHFNQNTNSFVDCFWQVFVLHNESVNIWSHLIPAVYFLALLLGFQDFIFHLEIPSNISKLDMMIIRIYLAGTTICLFSSVCSFHLIQFYSI
jgi:adiponectin receptor